MLKQDAGKFDRDYDFKKFDLLNEIKKDTDLFEFE